MEVILPFMALGGMYIISNRTEPFENDEKEEGNPVALLKSELEDLNKTKFDNNAYKNPNQTKHRMAF